MSGNQAPDFLLTQREVISILRISAKQLQRYRASGELPFYRFGHRSVRIRRADLEAFQKQRRIA